VYDCAVVDAPRPRSPRSESREVVELQSLRRAHPELGEAIDLQIEILELYRRVQGRVPVPWIEISTSHVTEHAATGQPLVAFEAIPIELTDLRLLVRQTAETMRRHGAIDDQDYARVQALGRDIGLLVAVGRWYRQTSEQHVTTRSSEEVDDDDPTLGQVLTVAMRPFLSRCAEVVQQRAELASWTCGHCAVCGADPDLSVLTASGERLLICGRCGLQWRFDPPTCPFCRNADPSRLSSFATPEGPYRVDACEVCHRYLKAYDARRANRPVMPIVDSVATLMLDAAALQRGYAG
jgi:hypothetical protein